jgi:hypothetical protein
MSYCVREAGGASLERILRALFLVDGSGRCCNGQSGQTPKRKKKNLIKRNKRKTTASNKQQINQRRFNQD